MREPRYSVFLHTFDQCVDRFCTQGYAPGHTISQQFAQALSLIHIYTLGNLAYIGHFHSAGVPGRGEPHKGELYYPALTRALEQRGYGGYFGMEYWPTYDDRQSVRDTLAYLKRGEFPSARP